MAPRITLIVTALFLLAGCDNFTPREKVATYDPETRQLTLPGPCPDWSQSQVHNYRNEMHSNFGCAVNNNLAVQLENPEDLHHGHGDSAPDPQVRQRYLQRYYSGEIPTPLTPIQSAGTGQ